MGSRAVNERQRGGVYDRKGCTCGSVPSLELYFQTDSESAVLVLECAGADEARRALETLPLVERGLIAFDLIPLRAYPGLREALCQRRLTARDERGIAVR